VVARSDGGASVQVLGDAYNQQMAKQMHWDRPFEYHFDRGLYFHEVHPNLICGGLQGVGGLLADPTAFVKLCSSTVLRPWLQYTPLMLPHKQEQQTSEVAGGGGCYVLLHKVHVLPLHQYFELVVCYDDCVNTLCAAASSSPGTPCV
jgi:hypothetical protein